MRTWLITGLILTSLATAAGAYSWLKPGPPVEAARARLDAIREFVDEEGRTRLPKTHLVTMPYAGRIEPIELVEGDRVVCGQVVVRVVPSDLKLDVDEAEAAVKRLAASIVENDDVSVESTTLLQSRKYVESMDRTVEAAAERVKSGEAKREFADKMFHRARSLAEKKAMSEVDLNQAEVNRVDADVDFQTDLLVLSALRSMHAATALLPTVVEQYITRKRLKHDVLVEEQAQAEIKLQEAKRDRDRGEMKSPVDGVVLERFETNERQVAPGTMLLSIGRPEELEVEVDVLSQDVVRVKRGQFAEIYGPAIGERPARGTVTRVYPSGFTKTSSLGVEQQRVWVVVRFDADELSRLRAERELGVGYRVRAKIYTAEKEQALIVPRSALFRGPAGDWQVFVVDEGVARLRSVEVGLLNDVTAEIIKGIAQSSVVVLVPETNLKDGDKVKAVIPDEG
jgi:HlyD family secretion protein